MIAIEARHAPICSTSATINYQFLRLTHAKDTNASAPVNFLTTSPFDINLRITKTVPIMVTTRVTTKTAEVLSAICVRAHDQDQGYALRMASSI
jgi:hypothetical protein